MKGCLYVALGLTIVGAIILAVFAIGGSLIGLAMPVTHPGGLSPGHVENVVGLGLGGLAIVAGILIPLAVILAPVIVVWLILKALMRSQESNGGGYLSEDETRVMQEIHHGLSKMEERLDALETIIIDHEKKGRNHE